MSADVAEAVVGTSAGEHVAAAAEAVRCFNHATFARGDCRLTVPEVYAVAADLSSLSYRLRQACDQLTRILRDRVESGGLACDDGSSPGVAVVGATDLLGYAGRVAEKLGDLFSAVQNRISIVSDGGL